MLLTKERGEALLVSQPILQSENRGILFHQRPDERFELIVRRCFQRDENKVGPGHFLRIVRDTKRSGRERKIAPIALDLPPVLSNRVVIAAEEEVDIVTVLGEARAVVSTECAGTDDADGWG